MSSESQKKIRSVKASLEKLTKKTSSQVGGGFQWCSQSRDECGNYTYCQSTCGGAQPSCIGPAANAYRKAKWFGGPGNFYTCLDGYHDTNPDCPLQPMCKNSAGVDMFPAPDPFYFYQHCKCQGRDESTGEPIPVCCQCPENTHDPAEYTCECESPTCHSCCDNPPPKECANYKDTRNDLPASHGWVCNCDSVLSYVESKYGDKFPSEWGGSIPNFEIPKAPGLKRTASGGPHNIQHETQIIINQIPFSGEEPQFESKLGCCLEFRRSNFAVGSSCCHPYSNAPVWRGYGIPRKTNVCHRQHILACTDEKGACCYGNRRQHCSGNRTYSQCMDKINPFWHGPGSKCSGSDIPGGNLCNPRGACCVKDNDGVLECKDNKPRTYCEIVGGNHYIDADCDDIDCEDDDYDYYEEDERSNHSESPPMKKATPVTGPFQGLMFNKCDPATWKTLHQPNIDDQGSPIPPDYDPRPRLCKRGCSNHPLLKDYDCSSYVKNKDKDAVRSLIQSLRINKNEG